MRKIFFCIFVAYSMILSFEAIAQERKAERHFDREAFEERRNAFITAEVGLTPDEAAAFIPLCRELRQKKFEISRDYRKQAREILHKKQVTDAEYEKLIDAGVERGLKDAELEKEYLKKFKKVLSAEKIYKYRNAEAKFVRSYSKEARSNSRKHNEERGKRK